MQDRTPSAAPLHWKDPRAVIECWLSIQYEITSVALRDHERIRIVRRSLSAADHDHIMDTFVVISMFIANNNLHASNKELYSNLDYRHEMCMVKFLFISCQE